MQPLDVKRLASPGVENGNYRAPNSRRRESRKRTHRMKGGKLAPVMATPILQSESGTIRQQIAFEVDRVMGRMVTAPFAKVVSVFVPVQAMHALKHPDHDYPGANEVIRELLKSGANLFDLEPESEVTQRCGINPRSVDGVKYVNESIALAHNCAVNYLRRRKYVKAVQLLAADRDITPALYEQTVLDRFGGVLDPDDRINGAIEMQLTGRLPTRGIRVMGDASTHAADAPYKDQAVPNGGTVNKTSVEGWRASEQNVVIETGSESGFSVSTAFHGVFSDLADADGAQVSLQDLYISERSDALIRAMREIVDKNPIYGEEMLADWMYGLQVDAGKQPFVLFERKIALTRAMQPGMDTAAIENRTEATDMMGSIPFMVPVPQTEFGGVIVTFASLLPDEVVDSQPHPLATQPWAGINFTLDEQKLDPQPVTIRDLHSDIDEITPAPNETAPLFYVGNNHMSRTYVDYGFARNVDETTVENKTALWQVNVPLSVTPQSVIYPENLEQYPWGIQDGDICTVHATSQLIVNSPLILGPSPVEELASVDLTPAES